MVSLGLQRAEDVLGNLDRHISDAKDQMEKLWEVMPEEFLNDEEFTKMILALKNNIELM